MDTKVMLNKLICKYIKLKLLTETKYWPNVLRTFKLSTSNARPWLVETVGDPKGVSNRTLDGVSSVTYVRTDYLRITGGPEIERLPDRFSEWRRKTGRLHSPIITNEVSPRHSQLIPNDLRNFRHLLSGSTPLEILIRVRSRILHIPLLWVDHEK